MPRHLRIFLDDSESVALHRIARRRHLTVAEWVRRALRAALREESAAETRRRIAVVRQAARGEFPTAEIGSMLTDIERGYLGAT
jgi:hypothetical protein